MSEYTRYLLNSAGIKATEQDIETIDASGHPDALVQALLSYGECVAFTQDEWYKAVRVFYAHKFKNIPIRQSERGQDIIK